MNDYKYPYIPKKYYPAVMFACNCIRKYGTFNVAVETAANKYGLDGDEIAKHVRARQGAGQKGKTRKYKYYAVCGYWDNWQRDYDYDIVFSKYDRDAWLRETKVIGMVLKATNLKNAENQCQHGWMDRDGFMNGETLEDRMIIECDTQEDAEKELKRLTKFATEKLNKMRKDREKEIEEMLNSNESIEDFLERLRMSLGGTV